MIYLDNAATCGKRPEKVLNTVVNTLKFMSANPGRSGHSLSIACARLVADTREKVAGFVGGSIAENVVFTKNCTEALNLALLGSLKPGGHVVTTCNEHNSVLRPLFEMQRAGIIRVTAVPPDASGNVSAQAIKAALTPDTYLVCCCHVSNVTGGMSDLAGIGKLARSLNLLFLSDCAQSAGHEDISADDMCVDMLAFAGHKGLFAPQGSGGLYFNDRVKLKPILYGGTGTESQSLYQPDESPETYESGTLNTPAIAGLNAGIAWLNAHRDTCRQTVAKLTAYADKGLRQLPRVTVRSCPNQAGIVSFEVERATSTDVTDYLNAEFGIACRGGLHCAPLIHRHLGTLQNGLTRVSFSPFNTLQEADRLLFAVRKLVAD